MTFYKFAIIYPYMKLLETSFVSGDYTDAQLKQTFAKLLPTEVEYTYDAPSFEGLQYHKDGTILRNVHDTELLHLCWMAEETFALDDNFNWQEYEDALDEQGAWKNTHSTWQQRVIALAKVKGVEIV